MDVGISVIFLYDKNKKILLQHRGYDEEFYPDFWGCFGGHIEDGETPESALKRELIEELEYMVSSPRLLKVSSFRDRDRDRQVKTYNFIEEYDTNQKLVQHEGFGYGWFTIDEALNLKITDLRREAIKEVDKFFAENSI